MLVLGNLASTTSEALPGFSLGVLEGFSGDCWTWARRGVLALASTTLGMPPLSVSLDKSLEESAIYQYLDLALLDLTIHGTSFGIRI